MNITAIRKKIKALMQMTVENGCTEAEALNAAKLLSAVLDEHGLSVSDIEAGGTEETTVGKETWEDGTVNIHDVVRVAPAIARLFDVKVWRQPAGKRKVIVYFGFPQDTAAAHAMTTLLRDAMEREWQAFKRSPAAREAEMSTRSMRPSFMFGMAQRLIQRLGEMKKARATPTTGTALIVLKNQVVATEFNKLGVELGRSRGRSRGSSASAFAAGVAAGERVGLTAGPHVRETRKVAS